MSEEEDINIIGDRIERALLAKIESNVEAGNVLSVQSWGNVYLTFQQARATDCWEKHKKHKMY